MPRNKDEETHDMPDIPIFIAFAMISGMISLILCAVLSERDKVQEIEDKRLIESFSRMSDDQQIQRAYERNDQKTESNKSNSIKKKE